MNQKFLVGAATAAHQVEGNNIHSDYWAMEHMKHSGFVEPSNDAVDHYNRYEEDICLMAEAGLNVYRFSIEWARIEPKENQFDETEIEHYRKVIDCCKENGIEPIITLHHFSSPAWLIGKGGWGKEYVVNAFAKYAKYVVQHLGKEVNYICTINEANMGYQLKQIAADVMNSSQKEGSVQVGIKLDLKQILLGMFEEGKRFHCSPFAVNTFLKPRSKEQEAIVMRAHQAAKKEIKAIVPDCKVGLTLSLYDYQSTEDGKEKAAKYWEDDFGFYFPYIAEDDFLGVQNYTRKMIDKNGSMDPPADAPMTQMAYEEYPYSIGNVLRHVAESYKGELIVTENGIATEDDSRRCEFMKKAFESVMQAKEEGVHVTGYCYWSLLDNFEWQAGYGKTFGLIAVDRKTQTRYPKGSLQALGSLTSCMCFDSDATV